MPHDFLSDEQIARYARFPAEVSVSELEQFFRLDSQARAMATAKRGPASKLGWTLQWGTVRMLGVFLPDNPTGLPTSAITFVAEQLDIDPACVGEYRRRQQTAYEHSWEIRDAFGYRDFAAGQEELRTFLAARVWTTEEGPRTLFDRAVVYLVENKVLLPGLTVLARMVATVRREENARLHANMHQRLPTTVQTAMTGLLHVPEDRRRSELERLRSEPTRASSHAMVAALDRVSEISSVGTGQIDVADVPAVKLDALAKYGLKSKAPTLRGLDEYRKSATLLATVRSLETSSVDDALDVLNLLMVSKLINRSVREGNEDKLNRLPELRMAAKNMAQALEVLLATSQDSHEQAVSLPQVWNAIEEVVDRQKLVTAVNTVAEQVPDDADAAAEWRARLVKRYRTVQGFIELLLDVIEFDATEAGQPVLDALRTAAPMARSRKHYRAEDIAAHAELTGGSWKRPIFANPNVDPGRIDKTAFIMCVMEHLHKALRRRDVFARGGDRWGDPRARLLSGQQWEHTRPTVLAALGLESEPAAHLAELASALEDGYHRVLEGLSTNTAVQFDGGKLRMDPLGAGAEPPLMGQFRARVEAMMPRVDFPDLLMEVAARTGFTRDFTHISGAETRMEDFNASLCALLVSEACNIGLTPVAKPGVAALTRSRLHQVDQGYVRAETISAANARLIEAQSDIGIVDSWGGGLLASADGMRFVVPVNNLHTRANPKYFGLRKRGATWLNVVNDQVMGLGGVVVPGTLRDSLFILDAIHARDGGEKPERVVTDNASYSDLVFGLFAICGYQFSPRIADLGDTRLWRTNTHAHYGPLDTMSRHTVHLDKIRAHWEDMLRVAGSLTTGAVRAHDLMRMLSRDGRPIGLGDAFAHYGRIFKTLHLLQFLHDESYRRMITAQLNTSEARHGLARKICHGNRGELRQRYRQGLEDQLGSLGLALNAVVWWNSLYIDAAVDQLRADGFPATEDMCARLSPLICEHINFLGSYTFPQPDVQAGLRPLRDPEATEE
ncbi:TnpA family transposase [Haloactinospora alba]|uniref:TnpA family transposase n=1 Tax=Haloactinospora alba TaxID=405555 RepID=A0A543NIN3_9ACTN|nr:Tn3 family transposase [Haloactinospora alba]TQN31697.1 TnpA family transposase [Haloactinospora alba]